jgi:uncharacterized membrane protein (DUF485 family)
MSDVDETTWRNRFIVINLLRIGLTLLVLVGLVVWQSDWLRPGGFPELGFPLAIGALVASFALPRYLERKWRSPRP